MKTYHKGLILAVGLALTLFSLVCLSKGNTRDEYVILYDYFGYEKGLVLLRNLAPEQKVLWCTEFPKTVVCFQKLGETPSAILIPNDITEI